MLCPRRMVITIATIGRAYFTRIPGSTSIPTDTKKIAPKRFLTGSTSFIILSASTVSARILPITNAPNALLNPTFVDITAIRQHSPKATIIIVSSFISLRVVRRNNGTMNKPTTNHSIRKKPIRIIELSISLPLGFPPSAMAPSITIITMARISSRMSTLITSPAKRCWVSPKSLKAL